ncbi:MAG: selenide, water dikinase SelD, partial [Acidobacteriota bacterium]|nr:selenide, water dikinase SelD [Acidobacteriota bacterium]
MRELLVVFGTVQKVLQAERLARQAGLDVDVLPAPRAVSSECGVVLEIGRRDALRLESLLAEEGLAPEAVFRAAAGAWLPTRLAAAEPPVEAGLTRASAYGGCGAKLAKGVLDTILCGLPRVQSEDLLVGIETADDAGVVRIDDDLGLIHTVDFFPPMVDDPFTFGRIAAANALSDVYAMGGTPLAGMNLVSFPLATTGRQVLKEILRGGLDALAEAGAVLAGGHTVEGPKLLLAVCAVTGKVDPHGGSVAAMAGPGLGDWLVLTKASGTGVDHHRRQGSGGGNAGSPLRATVRSMATLNRRAAEGPPGGAEPTAVTDVWRIHFTATRPRFKTLTLLSKS